MKEKRNEGKKGMEEKRNEVEKNERRKILKATENSICIMSHQNVFVHSSPQLPFFKFI